MSYHAQALETAGLVRVALPREDLEREAPGHFALVLLPDDARDLAEELLRAAQEVEDV